MDGYTDTFIAKQTYAWTVSGEIKFYTTFRALTPLVKDCHGTMLIMSIIKLLSCLS